MGIMKRSVLLLIYSRGISQRQINEDFSIYRLVLSLAPDPIFKFHFFV